MTLFVEAMPRIQAAEDLRAIGIYAIGSGSIKPEDRRRAIADLERKANPSRDTRKRHGSIAELAAMGIAVKRRA